MGNPFILAMKTEKKLQNKLLRKEKNKTYADNKNHEKSKYT